MAKRFFLHRTRKLFTLIWTMGFLTIFLSMVLSSCININNTCSGTNVTCKSGNYTALSPNSTIQAQAVATASTLQKNKPLAQDPLSEQDGNGWPVDNICTFKDGAYYVAPQEAASGSWFCSSSMLYRDAVIQMDVTLISGNAAGILLRVSPDGGEFYQFLINSGQGLFLLGVVGSNHQMDNTTPPTASSAIHGVGEKNTLLVIMKGTDFRFFINGTFVGETQDNSLTTGDIGVTLEGDSGGEARFANLVVYPV